MAPTVMTAGGPWQRRPCVAFACPAATPVVYPYDCRRQGVGDGPGLASSSRSSSAGLIVDRPLSSLDGVAAQSLASDFFLSRRTTPPRRPFYSLSRRRLDRDRRASTDETSFGGWDLFAEKDPTDSLWLHGNQPEHHHLGRVLNEVRGAGRREGLVAEKEITRTFAFVSKIIKKVLLVQILRGPGRPEKPGRPGGADSGLCISEPPPRSCAAGPQNPHKEKPLGRMGGQASPKRLKFGKTHKAKSLTDTIIMRHDLLLKLQKPAAWILRWTFAEKDIRFHYGCNGTNLSIIT
nr:hypothetical protein Iba_chr07fCG6140 [Ipomoea batatas]